MKTEMNETKKMKQTKETKVMMKKTDCSRTFLEKKRKRRYPAGKK